MAEEIEPTNNNILVHEYHTGLCGMYCMTVLDLIT